MIIVRRATIDDFESLVSAYTAAWRTGFVDLFSAATFMRSDFAQDRCAEVRDIVFGDETTTSVVELDDRVVGFSAVSIDNGIPCLDDVWVHPKAWGTGAAGALVAAAEDELRSAGFSRMTSWVPEDSPRARGLFERAGWFLTGEIEDFGIYTEEQNRLFEYGRVLI